MERPLVKEKDIFYFLCIDKDIDFKVFVEVSLFQVLFFPMSDLSYHNSSTFLGSPGLCV